MDFAGRKAATVASLGCANSDKSPKGSLDEPIIPLLNAINTHSSYFTTSSCSGRISIFSHPKPSHPSAAKKKAHGGSWLYVSHEPVPPDSVMPVLFSGEQTTAGNELVFRFEPLILAVECMDIDSALALVSTAISSGFRESGVSSVTKSRILVAIRCSIRMEVPLGESGNLLVSSKYVEFLVDVANQKMDANRKRTEAFMDALNKCVPVGSLTIYNEKHARGDDSRSQMDESVIKRQTRVQSCNLPIALFVVIGEPIEKLFLWGHTACTLNHASYGSIRVHIFGGFGGFGKHSRRNDSLLLDSSSGKLEVIDVDKAPSPRLGHTASLVGNSIFVIGGRTDSFKILNDVWVFNLDQYKWMQLDCAGCVFPPRHRHAAAVIGSNIYVFGGLNNCIVSSSLHVLNTENMEWKEIIVEGEQPCARHSHSLLAYNSQLFLFGGHDCEKALGDLYSFHAHNLVWKKEMATGRTRSPHARFSHSMFVYKNLLGIIGGCPIGQTHQELALFDFQLHEWKYVTLNFLSNELLVRCTASVAGDDLIIVGGGAVCYAFGIMFNKPLKINLLSLLSLQNPPLKFIDQLCHSSFLSSSCSWVLQIERKCAKWGKDILKEFGWLDLTRKVYHQEDGLYICFPVTVNFSALFGQRRHVFERFSEEKKDDMFCETMALDLLKEWGTVKRVDAIFEAQKISKNPSQRMKEAVNSLITKKGLSTDLLLQLPTRWEWLGDMVVFPIASFTDPLWESIGDEVWPAIASSLNCRRLARQGHVASTRTKDSNLKILVGDNGWVDHHENGIVYSFDATKCMFSWGNLSEKVRMANLDCKDETIVDLFAGIGYFVLPFLVRAKAKLVYACEWNVHAIYALKHNLEANYVSDRCVVLEGDNQTTAPKGVADRVCLGLLPTSEDSWVTAIKSLRREGGMLHVHGIAKDSEEVSWTHHVLHSIKQITKQEGCVWDVSIEHVERVKWYAPHVRHLVVDLRCSRSKAQIPIGCCTIDGFSSQHVHG